MTDTWEARMSAKAAARNSYEKAKAERDEYRQYRQSGQEAVEDQLVAEYVEANKPTRVDAERREQYQESIACACAGSPFRQMVNIPCYCQLSYLCQQAALGRPWKRPSLDEIDDAVDAWHEGRGVGLELHEYLGWSWHEYDIWVRFPHIRPYRPLKDWSIEAE